VTALALSPEARRMKFWTACEQMFSVQPFEMFLPAMLLKRDSCEWAM
jgi:hypothetical protein